MVKAQNQKQKYKKNARFKDGRIRNSNNGEMVCLQVQFMMLFMTFKAP